MENFSDESAVYEGGILLRSPRGEENRMTARILLNVRREIALCTSALNSLHAPTCIFHRRAQTHQPQPKLLKVYITAKLYVD